MALWEWCLILGVCLLPGAVLHFFEGHVKTVLFQVDSEVWNGLLFDGALNLCLGGCAGAKPGPPPISPWIDHILCMGYSSPFIEWSNVIPFLSLIWSRTSLQWLRKSQICDMYGCLSTFRVIMVSLLYFNTIQRPMGYLPFRRDSL